MTLYVQDGIESSMLIWNLAHFLERCICILDNCKVSADSTTYSDIKVYFPKNEESTRYAFESKPIVNFPQDQVTNVPHTLDTLVSSPAVVVPLKSL